MSDNYISTTAFNKCPYLKAKSVFSAFAVKEEVKERDGGGGGQARRELALEAAQGLLVTLVLGLTEAEACFVPSKALHSL